VDSNQGGVGAHSPNKEKKMSLIYEERWSDSPYIETVIHGHTISDDAVIRPAESHWHMVFIKHRGRVKPIIAGPLTTAGVASWQDGAEILWIKFKAGTFMPKLPFKHLLDKETPLPEATSQSFWLHGSAWQVPDFEDVEAFVDRLVRREAVVHDPVVKAMLHEQLPDMSPRTMRHRFLQATGLSQTQLRQIERAKRAEALLQQGVSVADTIYQTGYFDQPHLTKSLKQWIGHTPAQIMRSSTS
jgi:hypothetical protein